MRSKAEEAGCVSDDKERKASQVRRKLLWDCLLRCTPLKLSGARDEHLPTTSVPETPSFRIVSNDKPQGSLPRPSSGIYSLHSPCNRPTGARQGGRNHTFKSQRYGERYGIVKFQGQDLQLSALKRNGRHEETRTPDLYRVKVAL